MAMFKPSLHFWSQIVINVVKKTMKTKGKYKEKQRALLKVWLQKFSYLATLVQAVTAFIEKKFEHFEVATAAWPSDVTCTNIIESKSHTCDI